MNIIISSLDTNGIKITSTSATDIDHARLFVLKELNITPTRLDFFTEESIFLITPIPSEALVKKGYDGYYLSTRSAMPLEDYSIRIHYDTAARASQELEYSGTVEISNDLEDEHEIIMIKDRTISPVTTTMIAGDRNSQQLRFYIKKCYDGISFLDESKTIVVDFIPHKDLLPEGKTFYSSLVTAVLDDPEPEGESGDWILLKWNIPYIATAKAGTVKFALAVLGANYVWQTKPSSFTVAESIGLRENGTLTPEEYSQLEEIMENLDILQQDVDVLQQDVVAIEETLGNQTDDDENNDEYVIINGGMMDND